MTKETKEKLKALFGGMIEREDKGAIAQLVWELTTLYDEYPCCYGLCGRESECAEACGSDYFGCIEGMQLKFAERDL